ncbi:glycosyltransferase [Mesoterricola silvestris]|uniref:Glycosyltransferase WbpH n=1 Tax=Mesoterricola silvestris TaxID=2927979 RepID=A0AA48GNS2_9BACT|nr:glycosyltransferase [Mesoterricola silvestris]BDU71222.1 glycosyltransferase WbpH [Mesoterricola silvestris]
MKRMAVVTSAHPWGDPRVFGRELAACLEWGLEVHLFAVPPRDGWRPVPGLRLHPLPDPGSRLARIRGALGLWRAVLREGPFPLVHFHDPELLPAMALVGILAPGTFLLYDIHEDLPLQFRSKAYLPPWARQPLERLAEWALGLAARLFDGFAPATEAIARPWPRASTRVVHNYPRAVFHVPPRTPDPLRVLYMGGLSRGRGIPLALEAVRIARHRVPGLRLELAGWILEPEVGRLVKEAAREGWCRHLETLEAGALAAHAAGAGIGLVTLLPQPNYLESLPTKLFEYMALGIPVLASDFPLWRELVGESGAGRVVRPEAGPLAQALVAMALDPAALQEHARRGRAAYLDRYRWEVEAANLRWHLERAGALERTFPKDDP